VLRRARDRPAACIQYMLALAETMSVLSLSLLLLSSSTLAISYVDVAPASCVGHAANTSKLDRACGVIRSCRPLHADPANLGPARRRRLTIQPGAGPAHARPTPDGTRHVPYLTVYRSITRRLLLLKNQRATAGCCCCGHSI
jgi:hypothetical protein